MEVEIFTLCDAATDQGGKLNILGTFDAIRVRQFPAVHPHCAIALRVRFDRIEAGSHKVKIALVDEDGRPILPNVDGQIGVQMPRGAGSFCANLVLNINSLKFEREGQYAIDLALDGRQEKSLPLSVALMPPEASPPQAGGGPAPDA